MGWNKSNNYELASVIRQAKRMFSTQHCLFLCCLPGCTIFSHIIS